MSTKLHRAAPGGPGAPGAAAHDVRVLGFAQSLCSASNAAELTHRFEVGLPKVLHAPMLGMYFVDAGTGRVSNPSRVNVSDVFLSRYERMGRAVDAVLDHVMETGTPASNTTLMTMPEWLESPLYTRVSHLHRMRDVLKAPIVDGSEVIGTIHVSSAERTERYSGDELRLAGAVGRLVGTAVAGFRQRADLERQRDEAITALELTDVPVVVCDPGALEPRLSPAAQRLLALVADADLTLHRILAGAPADAGFSRAHDVDLVAGGRGRLRGHSRRLTRHGDAVVTVLDLVIDPMSGLDAWAAASGPATEANDHAPPRTRGDIGGDADGRDATALPQAGAASDERGAAAGAEIGPRPDARAGAETGVGALAGPQAGTLPGPGPGAPASAGAGAGAGAGADTGTGAVSGTGADAGTGAVAGAGARAGAGAGAGAGGEAMRWRQHGGAPDPRVLLTPREREVAELVVTGLTDRAIAGELWLSHHTVSQHVKRVYRKLGVSSRVELTRLLVSRARPS